LPNLFFPVAVLTEPPGGYFVAQNNIEGGDVLRRKIMGRLGIHSFVWTGGQTQAMLEEAMEKSAECGYRLIEFAYLKSEKFNLDQLARRAKSLDLDIAVTMGLPFSADVSSENPETVKAGERLLADAVKAVRDIGGGKLGGILYSAHAKYNNLPTRDGRQNSIAAIARTAEIAKAAGIDLVLEIVNRFETNLLNTTAQGLDFIKATGSDHVRLHLDTFHMNIEEANPAAAIRLAGDKLGYFHIGESNRGYLGDGVLNFDLMFDALLDIGYQRDITFESFSSAVVDESLSLACAIWRDTWTENMPLAQHAKAFIDLKMAEAARRRETNARP
jgi:D-psicose/D-tagatose/L-ribulose 3-epimerase